MDGGTTVRETDAFEYEAFISYAHEDPDRLLAKWLYHQLRTYRPPKSVGIECPPLPRRVFLDEMEGSAAPSLSAAIKTELDRSRFLIVVCSPRARVRQWIQDEVSYFRTSGRGILALLIEGEPRDAFPEPLFELDPKVVGEDDRASVRFPEEGPWAADVRPSKGRSSRKAKRIALLRLAAPILGCPFRDLLRLDDERRQRRRLAIVALSAVVFCSFFALVSWGLVQRGKAAREKEMKIRVRSNGLLAASRASLADDPERSLLLALEARRLDATAPVDSALHEALVRSRVRSELHGGGQVTSVAWSRSGAADGPLLALGCEDGSVRLWDRMHHESSLGRGGTVTCLAWSKDGTRLAWGSKEGVTSTWTAGGPIQSCDQIDGWFQAVAWSPDGKRLAEGCSDGRARIWSADGTVDLTGHAAGMVVYSVAWSPDGHRLATAAADETARIWSAEGTLLQILKGHENVVSSVAWSPDGERLATASWDRNVRVWDSQGRCAAVLAAHDAEVTSVAWSDDGARLASASSDRTVRVWDVAGDELRERPPLSGHGGRVWSVAWSPDGKELVSGSEDETARIWSLDGEEAPSPPRQKSALTAVAWSPDGTMLSTASADGTARVWTADGRELATLRHAEEVSSVTWSHDGKRLATASNRVARIWSIDGNETAELRHDDEVWSTAWSPEDSCLATACLDGTARVWNVDRREVLHPLRHEPREEVFAVAWSPRGERLATALSNGKASLWRVDGARVLDLTPQGALPEHGLSSVVWSPDGSRLATTSWDTTARIWSATGAEGPALRGHERGVLSAAWSRDGRLATASGDRTVRIWSAEGDELAVLRGHDDAVTGVAWSLDDTRLASASADGRVLVWLTRTDELLALAKERLAATGRDFSAVERERYKSLLEDSD